MIFNFTLCHDIPTGIKKPPVLVTWTKSRRICLDSQHVSGKTWTTFSNICAPRSFLLTLKHNNRYYNSLYAVLPCLRVVKNDLEARLRENLVVKVRFSIDCSIKPKQVKNNVWQGTTAGKYASQRFSACYAVQPKGCSTC